MSVHTVFAWKYGNRQPSIKQAKQIIKQTEGRIDYESIYGSFVTEYIRKGADFLAIITNDAWWGNTAGHRQLLSYSRIRAIENRRSIVRSANTGISAIINIKGELINQLPFNQKGLIRGYFSPAKEITFYTQYGDYIARWSNLIMILFVKNRKK